MKYDISFPDSISLSEVSSDPQMRFALMAMLEKNGKIRIESKTGPDYRFEGNAPSYQRTRLSDGTTDPVDVTVLLSHLKNGDGTVYVEELECSSS